MRVGRPFIARGCAIFWGASRRAVCATCTAVRATSWLRPAIAIFRTGCHQLPANALPIFIQQPFVRCLSQIGNAGALRMIREDEARLSNHLLYLALRQIG